MSLHATEGGRYEGAQTSAYSPNLARPGRRAPGGRRAALKIALCLLLPPIGVVYVWRTGSFRLRGRVLATLMATVSLSVMLLPTTRSPQLKTVSAQPATPVGATRAPESDAKTALSNIEQLLIKQEADEAAKLGDSQGSTNDAQAAADLAAANEVILNTIVYSVSSGAKRYHIGPTCGTQSNRVQLTVREALNKGLAACDTCNPPVPQME